MVDHVGRQLGNYHLTRLLGEGGFAQVYLGEHVHLQTRAAIKVQRTVLTEEDREQFRKEAQTVAKLDHPNIVRVLEFGVEGDTLFLVMSYAPNGSLRQRHSKGSVLPLPTVVSYVKQVAAALQFAHDQKLMHLDIKPENMLVGTRNEVLLSDFGLATVTRSTRSTNLEDKSVGGTALYMAPEQFRNDPCLASDQYALAIVVYEWLCGTPPFSGDPLQLAHQHRDIPPPPLRDKNPALPSAVEQVVLKALAKDPHERFENVQAFATSLEEACKLSPEPPPPEPPPPIVPPVSPPHKPAKNISRIILVALALLLSIVGLFYLVGPIPKPSGPGDATATANPIDDTMGILKLHEPLTTNSNIRWDNTSGACTFAEDGYHVIGEAQTAIPHKCLAHNLNTFSDFTFQVQMNLVKGTGGGILFRQTSSSAYYFRLSKDGHYALLACAGTDCSKMLVSNFFSRYDPHNQTNTLAVVARGMRIELYVNKVRIDSVDDTASLEGQIGVAAETGSEAVFREAKLWTPTPPPLELDKNTLYMFWSGAGDQNIYWTRFDGTTWSWSPQQRVSNAQTSNAPTLAIFQDKLLHRKGLFMVWKGPDGDEHIYWARFDGARWSSQNQIPYQTSNAPTLAIFQDNKLFIAWRDPDGHIDSAVSFDGTTWSPHQVPAVRTSNAPALTIFQNRLFMVWKGIGDDPHLYWAVSFDGINWSPQQHVPGVEASSSPALAIFQNRLFMVWKGIRDDPGVYWASFDGARWSSQSHVPVMEGTSSAPALATFQNKLFMVWKGIGRGQKIYWASFDGTWSKQLPVPGVGKNNAPALATF